MHHAADPVRDQKRHAQEAYAAQPLRVAEPLADRIGGRRDASGHDAVAERCRSRGRSDRARELRADGRLPRKSALPDRIQRGRQDEIRRLYRNHQ